MEKENKGTLFRKIYINKNYILNRTKIFNPHKNTQSYDLLKT